MESITEITIPETREISQPSKYTVYIISIKGPVRSWSVSHRYSEFDRLHQTLFKLKPTPLELPKKAVLKFSSVLLEERRKGLEAYLQSILYSKDIIWRVSKEWKEFLNIPEISTSDSYSSYSTSDLFDPALWIREFESLLTLLSEIQVHINEKDKMMLHGDTNRVQMSKFQARKGIHIAKEALQKIDQSLKDYRLKISTREYARRQDLLLNTMNQLKKLEDSTQEPTSIPKFQSSARVELLGTSPARSSRKFGVSAVETDQTRALNNQGLLQLQHEQLQNQDIMVENLAKIVKRQREIGLTISDELDFQNHLLQQVQDGVDKVEDNMVTADKKMKRIING